VNTAANRIELFRTGQLQKLRQYFSTFSAQRPMGFRRIWRFLRIDFEKPGTALDSNVNQPGGGVDRAACADRDEKG
jgi:hypothetical protein